MSELSRPVARRLQRPSWRDSRLVVGVLLVLLAATLGAKAIASADDRVPVWVAAVDLVAGDPVEPTSFVRADVQLAEGMSDYLGAGSSLPAGSFMVRDVRSGELVPTSAVGPADAVDVRRVTVRADASSTSGLARGSRVDVFVTPKLASGTGTAPTRKLLESAAVAAVLTSSGGFGTSSTTSVQLYVAAGQVQPVIEAVDSDATLTLVPAVGAVTGGVS
jgi:hypothetical protein